MENATAKQARARLNNPLTEVASYGAILQARKICSHRQRLEARARQVELGEEEADYTNKGPVLTSAGLQYCCHTSGSTTSRPCRPEPHRSKN